MQDPFIQAVFSLISSSGLSFANDLGEADLTKYIKTEDSNLVEGDFNFIMVVKDTVFNKIILKNNNQFTGLKLSAKLILTGDIKAYSLISGKVIAFKSE
ncbi:hypothetical protein FACHB389_10665 [Nostoc calcicola FACHB-389]|nr:hypothetical protein [Nostoc calcicola FACHB-3891]OKH36967.1 hypothetical protein FACHB389_10665 [Nostoc calcicola FACHB-389]